MNRIASLSILLLSTVLISFSSCERKGVDMAGKGGNATLRVTPQHHGNNIDSCTIFIKYNAQDKPSSYDEEVICVLENGKPVATFSELKKGDYYIYGQGWDKSIDQSVLGGIPYKINEETVLNITVPVTEGDHE